jgi:hypothetical protein
MFLQADSSFAVQMPYFAAGIPRPSRQGIHANPLILQCDQARGPPKSGRFAPIFENSLLAGNLRPAKAWHSAPAVASLKEASSKAACAVSRETNHERST